jgi:uncharacterized protein
MPDYPPGTPMWVDVTVPDVASAARFYGQLFGWDAEDMGEEAGHYTMFRKGGKMVAAASPPMNPQAPPSWTTYFSTTDATASAKAVKDAGGQVVMEPFDVMDAGRMAGFLDPGGGFFAVWQPGQHKGAELSNATGSFCWNELHTRDLNGAKQFYPKALGLGVKEQTYGDSTYVEWQLNDRSVAGAMPMDPSMPAQMPPFWLVYFAVDDTDAAVSKVQELGGTVRMAAMDAPPGRFAIVSDPFGAAFGVIKLTPQT